MAAPFIDDISSVLSGEIVKVYRNLNKGCLSVVAMTGENKGRVVAYTDQLRLLNAVFKVSQSGRERVLRERRKNVHAGIVGEVSEFIQETEIKVNYNPYEAGQFMAEGQNPVNYANSVSVSRQGIHMAAE